MTCLTCASNEVEASDSEVDNMEEKSSNSGKMVDKYIGESSRPLGLRVKEHYSNLRNLKIDSFMVEHWMNHHGVSMIPPEFQFKVVSSYKDSMSRQLAEALLIETEGTFNRKLEFGNNHLCRLESSVSGKEQERNWKLEEGDRANRISNLTSFFQCCEKCDNLMQEYKYNAIS